MEFGDTTAARSVHVECAQGFPCTFGDRLCRLRSGSRNSTEYCEAGREGSSSSISSLRPTATFKIGETADWVLVTKDAIWIAGTKPYSVQRIDPRTNRIVANVTLAGVACSGLEFGFGSVWVALCATQPALVRISTLTNKIAATLPIAPAGPEGGITASSDSI